MCRSASFLVWWSLVVCITSTQARVVTNETYWADRNALMDEEREKMLGSDLTLSSEEEQLNEILMREKLLEISVGFNESNFLPAKSFFLAKEEIDQSNVFKLIRDMPKGAVLHGHDMALASVDWVVSELTYWDNLYMCYLENDRMRFRFFNTPDSSCSWLSVADERAMYVDPNSFDETLRNQLSILTDNPAEDFPDVNTVWIRFGSAFESLEGLTMYVPAWESYLTRTMQEFMDDNVSYFEFRGVLPPLYDLDGNEFTPEESIAVYVETVQTFLASNSDRFFGVKFIYAPSREVNEDVVWEYVDLAAQLKETFPNFVAGFDLVGQEDMGRPLKNFIAPILDLQTRNISVPVFFHAGETNWEGVSTDENLFDALLLNSTRIGHGYAITKHPSLIEMAIEKDIPVEINPISNQVLALVQDLRNHPMANLMATNFPVIVSSDDPGLWGALPLSHDFYEAFFALGGAKADLRFLKKLALNSIRYSSLDDELKIQLGTLWQSQWDAFISSSLKQFRESSENEDSLINGKQISNIISLSKDEEEDNRI